MKLPEGVKSSCDLCYRRPSVDGGSGSCPFSPSVRRSFAPTGPHDDCRYFDQREYLSPRAKRELANNPQEAALF